MFNEGTPSAKFKDPPRAAGERTKELIFEKALELFRQRGFEEATMRNIARAAKVATGAAYYYFPSKESIVLAYYGRVQSLHAARVRAELAGKEGLRDRLGAVLHAKLELLRNDKMFLGALFRYTGEAGHPLSVFGKGTEVQRKQSTELFRQAMEGTEMSKELRELLPWVMWLLHLGMILFFIHDESQGQSKSHKLVDSVLDLVTGVLEFTNSALVRPFVKPLQARMLGMLREAGWAEEL
jgi:AcrR family transcriptional regulator